MGQEERKGVENKKLLWIAMVSFSLFAIAELIASILSNSEALLGDALTMMVDGVSYGVNLWADKAKIDKSDSERLKIDLIAPAASITALLAVTVYVTVEAVTEINLSKDAEPDVDATVMWSFASVNLVLDFLNLGLFLVKKTDAGKYYLSCSALRCFKPGNARDTTKETDLNMLSALAHVAADTLRSVAVLIAGIAADENYIDSSRADAIGGIIVSVAIVLSILPIVKEMITRSKQLKAAWAKESYQELLLGDTDAWGLDEDDDEIVLLRE
eukprot:m.29223 g.29223  ORF g.29223 m.29223 type:complete len:271 (-) comp16059_c0_seq1:114-926(-)